MTKNIVESLNPYLRHACKFPISTLVEFVHDMIQRWFYDKRNKGEKTKIQITKWASNHVLKTLDATQIYEC